eukprot:CAMPEP_0113660632 /NCGR_PEP_ID=MMETSP0017_2-20120614/33006_1 /TAXON_ID=2856 /ORGANISM="Cylindrotheca closterium" /LENGTH=165 /DNA_ID=CAMNT_0000575285 /DNA_START=94 /DNA_END=588 /DNA_ORIENTATION=+ /assembly_acc=CAM_ASM_000147
MSGPSSSTTENTNNIKCCFGFRLFGSQPDPIVSTDASTVDTEEANEGKSPKKKNFLSKFTNNNKDKKATESSSSSPNKKQPQPPKTLLVIANKPKVDSYIGLSLKKYKRKNTHILVHSVSPKGLLTGSLLKQGQKVVSINNIDCPEDLKSAIDLLKTAPAGPLRI